MITLYYKDERVKLSLFILSAFIIQGIIFGVIYFNSILAINKDVITQNSSIIGELYLKDKELALEIIPIITGKNLNNVEIGEKILSDYSYNTALKYNNNPVIGNITQSTVLLFEILILVTFLILIIGSFIIMNPLYNEIKYLTHRAESIVENKIIHNDNQYSCYRGSLDKFILKFNLMEDRIKNSIGLLQEEKINLKNIINDISHQLKTPLTALSMYNDIISDHREMNNEDLDNFINLSKDQLERMEWLVKTLLKYARLESNVVEYNKEMFSIKNTIEESINPLKVKAKNKNQSLILKCEKDIEYYHDRKWVSEAISNIVKNAIEHTENNGKIEINLYETPITITISIKDNGEGIEKEELKKIFNRFYKGETSINPTSIGIGLCLSKSIIKAHNGDITVESYLGKGSIFYITFLKTVL
ncbi:HAMP domain-containing histidine kinase [Clostridium botulinum]|uniref:sensor histidine kinase n=1 Tax=Clostridium botulinum TaxID=1491 RepID=UPI000773D2F9|nr:HAMP domain-containing sensor histidine kinase [Clostridium botulinum]NFL87282.1 HAMP domain-containing histidine kinase [Clostridium botulinum]NFO22752.1 HAMP domain-containing histidine kinase [Clostridium botulinum]HBJ1648177.1 HAMP domain-containing histidine kinase [Clostridium botulinum]HBJ2622003.1 HAMP domain-containing histidine kinase [Clostridium botulinum]